MRLLVIGSGPGGYVAAIRAAQLGGDVTLVEKGKTGGTCLNVGCIPTKVLLHATELLGEIRQGEEYGIHTGATTLNWDTLLDKKDKVIQGLCSGVDGLLKKHKIMMYNGTASFVDTKTVKVLQADGKTAPVPFDKCIIATGSETVQIPIPGIDLSCVGGSEEALSYGAPPAQLVVIGGGVIGVELATVYARLGCQVTIVEALDRILPNMDAELVKYVVMELRKLKVKIHTGCRVSAIQEAEGGGNVLFATEKGEEKSVFGEKVLMSVGRRPVTKGLGLENLNLKMDRAAICVNDCMCTSLPHIYAIGDCTGGMMLAHVASAQGTIAAENAVLGRNTRYSNKIVPGCVYTKPELASVGLTEEQARLQYGNVQVGRFNLSANGKAVIMGAGGTVKFVTHGDTGEILGLHILGPRATDMIMEGALALRLEATVEEIMSTIHPHPTVVEGLQEAASDVWGLAIHKH